jgi:NAD(P)-dependent dehydrogenase (short-subunit alcohol dehydrogenase family)
MSTSQSKKVALVTGGNRGIGFAISKQLALKGISVIIGSRDISQGEATAKSIRPLPPAGGTTTTETTTVSACELNVTDQDSVDRLTSTINSKFGKIDVLVNNAAILLDDASNSLPSKTDLQIVRATLETNLIGTWRLCQSFLPMMKKNKYGRIVNVSSGAGALTTIQQSLYAPAYSLSKSSLNVLTIMLANELRRDRETSNILVNAVDPGWVRTDMGGPAAPRSAEEGADTAVWLATLPDRGPTGGFFFDRKRIEW